MGFGRVTVAYQRVSCWAFRAMRGGFCRFGSLNPLCFRLWIMSVSVSLSSPKLMIGWARFSPQSLRSLDPACNSLLMPSWWTKPYPLHAQTPLDPVLPDTMQLAMSLWLPGCPIPCLCMHTDCIIWFSAIRGTRGRRFAGQLAKMREAMTAKGHLIFLGISRGKWGLKKEGKLFIYNTIWISIYLTRYSCQYTAWNCGRNIFWGLYWLDLQIYS